MTIALVKEEAHKLVDKMPSNSTWEDLMHEIYVRQAIERGLADSHAGRTADVREVRAKYGYTVHPANPPAIGGELFPGHEGFNRR